MIKDIVTGLVETYNTNNPFEICDYLGIKIIRSNLGNEINGFFQRTKDGYEIIHLNLKLNDNESNYTCAHELGHAIMHTDLSIGFFIENRLQVKNRYEIQADNFAAELLLPNILSCEYTDMNIEQLSSYFGVPIDLISYKYRKESNI